MKTKTETEIVQSLANYKIALNKAKGDGALILGTFEKMYSFITIHKNLIPTDLYVPMVTECVRNALVAAKRYNLHYKEFSKHWSKNTVDKTFNLCKNIRNAFKDGDSNTEAINIKRLFELLLNEEGDASTILYCWSLYDQVEEGHSFIHSNKQYVQTLIEEHNKEKDDSNDEKEIEQITQAQKATDN